MTNEIRNVPKLRFLEFNDGWNKKKVSEFSETNYGGGTPKTNKLEYWNGDIPWIQSSDLVSDKLYLPQSRKGITEDAISNSATKLIPSKSIAIVTRVGVGKLAFIDFKYSTSQDFISLSNLRFDNCFSVYALYNKIKIISKNLQGTSIKGITKNELLNTMIFIPLNTREQQKIGGFFSKLDQQIELEEQKLAKLEEQKKGYMQKVFSQELRFKDENGNDYDEWKEEKLENIADFQNGKAHENLVSIEGEYVLVNSKFISTDTRIKKHVSQQLTPLNKEDIAIVMSDIPNGKALAKCFLIDENNKYSLNQRIGRIYNILGDSRFLYLILNRNKQLLKYDSGVGQTNLKKSEITDILLNWPIKEEQQKIGDFFKKVDELIETQFSKVELLKERKKGFLQKMFV